MSIGRVERIDKDGPEAIYDAFAPTDQLAPRFSDEDIALRFSGKHANDLRYVSGWGKWIRWDETRWLEDSTLRVFDLARAICREAAAECEIEKPNAAPKLAAAATVAAVERLARADRRHAVTVDQWDENIWLLNTPSGTVNLATGQIRAHERHEYITKITSAGIDGSDCPIWLRFLERVTGGDVELYYFLQRVVGYCLTGDTREHALFFLYGTGANGKSVFTSTVTNLLGEYSKTAPISTFLSTGNEQHPTDLAGLRGARLVTAVETEDGRRWAESKIKTMTGGDKIAARFMRQDFFEFTPQFKLLIAGNHKPGLRNVDEAIRRRLHLVPFNVTIPAEERDKQLCEKLRAEWSGILHWAVEGCLEWQRRGLNPPPVVLDATEIYLKDEDRIALWIEDQCTTGSQFSTTVADLFQNWQTWCEAAEEKPGSKKRFCQALYERGYQRSSTRDARSIEGIGIKVAF